MHEANGTAKARIAYFPIISNGTVALTNDREILVWLPLETTLNAGPGRQARVRDGTPCDVRLPIG